MINIIDEVINETILHTQFPFTEAVLKETLRMYPLTVSAFRKIDQDNLVINGNKVPKGT